MGFIRIHGTRNNTVQNKIALLTFPTPGLRTDFIHGYKLSFLLFNFPIIAGPGHRSPHNCNRFILLTLNSFLRPMRPGASRICIQAPSSSPVSLSPRVSVSHARVQCSLLHHPWPVSLDLDSPRVSESHTRVHFFIPITRVTG